MMRFPIWRLKKNTLLPLNQLYIRLLGLSARHMSMDYAVIHDEKNKEFYIDLTPEKAVLQYQLIHEEPKIIDMYHTGVPESQRGKGIAGNLVKAAFSFVVANNLRVRPTCTYVQHYIDKNKPTEIMQRLEK
ncbi:protein NATD1-like [Dendronephthya gigantea]|uniref:protein NATD1-like n=1 Tax=Dendronephthya gigantea TaxID=151771 RepID=UPI00106CF4F7|nr:protein NATD1-like [Dendronephthya gigantea]